METQQQRSSGFQMSQDDALVTNLLIKAVSASTGYPSKKLDLDLDLEADLGIHPFKRQEILSIFGYEINRCGLPTPTHDDLQAIIIKAKTLREIVAGTRATMSGLPPRTIMAGEVVTPLPRNEAARRINVNFSQSAYDTLDELAKRKDKSMSDILREAIQLEKWISDCQEQGWHVLLEKDGRVRELIRF